MLVLRGGSILISAYVGVDESGVEDAVNKQFQSPEFPKFHDISPSFDQLWDLKQNPYALSRVGSCTAVLFGGCS